MSDGHGARNGARLRLARQARRFSQQQLAAMAGVSRQAVSAVESGQSDPSLRAALGLARALGMTVEEVFGSSSPAPQVVARPVAALGGEGARVTLAPMGEGLVPLPLSDVTVSRAGFLPAGGLAAGAGPDMSCHDINSDFATCVPFSEGTANGRRVVVRADRTAACTTSYAAWRGPARWQRAQG
jgi:transcriptional regulator with XRE-family HTH domain